jgi:hypothetical protein
MITNGSNETETIKIGLQNYFVLKSWIFLSTPLKFSNNWFDLDQFGSVLINFDQI